MIWSGAKSAMFRLLVAPVIIGILAFSLTCFISPLLFSESDIVAVWAESVLTLSNSIFATMPPLIASYIANLNLLSAALTVALLLTAAIPILLIVGDAFMLVARWIISIFKRKPKPVGSTDLPAIDIDASGLKSSPGKRILGGGFDSLDSD